MILLSTFPLTQPVAIFLTVLLIMLLAPMIFTRLKIPNIVGLILAGMAVGKYGFNLLIRDASFEIFGQVGILYLMFLAGVEIDMYNLRKNIRGGIFYGLLTFLVPMTLGIFVSRHAFSTGWGTAVLLATMYASHTLISYPIVNRFRLSNARSVVISVSGTIIAVLLALITLAEVVDVRVQGGFSFRNIAMLGVETIVYSLVIGFIYPRLTRYFFRRYSDSVLQFIYILALVMLSALFSHLIGLEAILGAFYAGLVLNRYVPGRSALMTRLVFVGNAIFIPYFLIGVGMLINVRVIFSGWSVVYVAGVMTAIALGSKWLAAEGTRRVLGMDRTEGNMLFGLSSGKAAATIAATMVGYQYGLLTEEMMNGAVLMILICCWVASVVTERAAMKLRIRLTSDSLEKDVEGSRQNARQVVAVANPVTSEEIMNLAILMRHPDNREEMTTLFVRSSDDRRIVSVGREALRIATTAAMAVDIRVKEVERVDINIVQGMVSVMKERRSTDLILGMHRKASIVDSFYGNMMEQLVSANHQMIIMSRCFVPVDTVQRLIVVVPRKAEYETGFRKWVERMGNLATQLVRPIVFMASSETSRFIRGVLAAGEYSIDQTYEEMETWDDFITKSGEIENDDLMVVIGARRTSVSYSSVLDELPSFLQRYFSAQNLIMIYPEQFGAEERMPEPIDVLSQQLHTSPGRNMMTAKQLLDSLLMHRRWQSLKRRGDNADNSKKN